MKITEIFQSGYNRDQEGYSSWGGWGHGWGGHSWGGWGGHSWGGWGGWGYSSGWGGWGGWGGCSLVTRYLWAVAPTRLTRGGATAHAKPGQLARMRERRSLCGGW